MNRRDFLQGAALGAAGLIAGCATGSLEPSPLELEEATIADLRKAMTSGRETALSLVEKCLSRIASIDKDGPALNSVIELNPEAAEIARALDRERAAKGPRGPLHGIPILIK